MKAVGTVAGFYINQVDWEVMVGGESEYQKRLQDGDAALKKWEESGEVSTLL